MISNNLISSLIALSTTGSSYEPYWPSKIAGIKHQHTHTDGSPYQYALTFSSSHVVAPRGNPRQQPIVLTSAPASPGSGSSAVLPPTSGPHHLGIHASLRWVSIAKELIPSPIARPLTHISPLPLLSLVARQWPIAMVTHCTLTPTLHSRLCYARWFKCSNLRCHWPLDLASSTRLRAVGSRGRDRAAEGRCDKTLMYAKLACGKLVWQGQPSKSIPRARVLFFSSFVFSSAFFLPLFLVFK